VHWKFEVFWSPHRNAPPTRSKTPPRLQAKVLNYGIATAAVLRLVMILLGTELVERFEPALALFAAVLLWSAWGLLFGEDGGEEDLADNKARRGVGGGAGAPLDLRARTLGRLAVRPGF
jgi:hypothetical protein